jgi:hypothetical protein
VSCAESTRSAPHTQSESFLWFLSCNFPTLWRCRFPPQHALIPHASRRTWSLRSPQPVCCGYKRTSFWAPVRCQLWRRVPPVRRRHLWRQVPPVRRGAAASHVCVGLCAAYADSQVGVAAWSVLQARMFWQACWNCSMLGRLEGSRERAASTAERRWPRRRSSAGEVAAASHGASHSPRIISDVCSTISHHRVTAHDTHTCAAPACMHVCGGEHRRHACAVRRRGAPASGSAGC